MQCFESKFQREPDRNMTPAIRAIRVLPFALPPAVGAYLLLERFGVGPDWAAGFAAIRRRLVPGKIVTALIASAPSARREVWAAGGYRSDNCWMHHFKRVADGEHEGHDIGQHREDENHRCEQNGLEQCQGR